MSATKTRSKRRNLGGRPRVANPATLLVAFKLTQTDHDLLKQLVEREQERSPAGRFTVGSYLRWLIRREGEKSGLSPKEGPEEERRR